MKHRHVSRDKRADLARAKLNPSAEFAHPHDVINNPDVSGSEKKAILDQWEVDAQALSRASDEGMTGGEPPRLRAVQKARRKVAGAGGPRKDRRTSGKPAG